MEIREDIIKEVKNELVDVLCDICGASCKKEMNYEFLELKTHWGYESKKDLEKWTAEVCEPCVDKHLKPLIKFKVEEYL